MSRTVYRCNVSVVHIIRGGKVNGEHVARLAVAEALFNSWYLVRESGCLPNLCECGARCATWALVQERDAARDVRGTYLMVCPMGFVRG